MYALSLRICPLEKKNKKSKSMGFPSGKFKLDISGCMCSLFKYVIQQRDFWWHWWEQDRCCGRTGTHSYGGIGMTQLCDFQKPGLLSITCIAYFQLNGCSCRSSLNQLIISRTGNIHAPRDLGFLIIIAHILWRPSTEISKCCFVGLFFFTEFLWTEGCCSPPLYSCVWVIPLWEVIDT